MDTSLEPAIPSHVAARKPPRQRLLIVATSFASAGVAMFFLALLAIYASVRNRAIEAGEGWFTDRILPLTPGNMTMATLALSGVMVAWVVYAVHRNDRTNAYVAIGGALVLAAAAINALLFLLSETGLVVAESNPAAMLFTITGAFVGLVVVAMAYLVLVGFRIVGSTDTSKQSELAVSAALFWFVMVLVYAVLWYGVFIAK